jgi:hypothetical protein
MRPHPPSMPSISELAVLSQGTSPRKRRIRVARSDGGINPSNRLPLSVSTPLISETDHQSYTVSSSQPIPSIRRTFTSVPRMAPQASSSVISIARSKSRNLNTQRDRYATTSYTESLDVLLKSPVNTPPDAALADCSNQSRTASDPADRPQAPTSTALRQDDMFQPGVSANNIGSAMKFQSIQFISMTSLELLQLSKTKGPKVVGRYILGGVLGEGDWLFGRHKFTLCRIVWKS